MQQGRHCGVSGWSHTAALLALPGNTAFATMSALLMSCGPWSSNAASITTCQQPHPGWSSGLVQHMLGSGIDKT